MKWKIKNIEINNQVGLAPMAGISNPPYIKICEKMSVGWVVSELISSEAIVRNNKKTFEMLNGYENITVPFGIQIFGSDAKTMGKASKIICDYLPNVSFIDINMGCPVPKVAIKNNAGSALLKEPKKVFEIVKCVVESVNVPVTVKIRSGWDEEHINAVEIAKICESANASAICIHARTRKQAYSGMANWDIIKDVVNEVNIPVIGNGDILTCYDAKRMLEETKCSAVMVARGAIGNPWLIKECIDYIDYNIIPKEVSIKEKLDMMRYHINEYTKNESFNIIEIRPILMYYLKGLPNTKNIKLEICKTNTIKGLINIIDNYEKEIME